MTKQKNIKDLSESHEEVEDVEAEDNDEYTVVVVVVADEIPHVEVGILFVDDASSRESKVGVLHCVLKETIERET